MSYNQEFCEFSEYVQGQKVRPLTKSTDLYVGISDLRQRRMRRYNLALPAYVVFLK